MNNITELVFILDRSGSMAGLESDTIGGFNAMLKKQKKERGTAYVSNVLFDNTTRVLHDRVQLRKVPAARRCWTPSAARSTTSATSISTPAPRMFPPIRCLSSPPTAWRMPAAAMTKRRSSG